MSVRIGSLYVSLMADLTGFQSGMSRAGATTAATSGKIRQELGLTERSIQRLNTASSRGFDFRGALIASKSFETMNSRVALLRGTLLATTTVMGGLGAALGANLVSRYADQFTSVQNALRTTTKDAVGLGAATEAIREAANRARSSLSATSTLYTRLFKATPNDGADRILRRVETVQKALALGGATAQEAESAAIQLSQAFQANKFNGDEFRAVMETPLGTKLAEGLGVTTKQLREMSTAGQLTAKELSKALDAIGKSIDTDFAKSNMTLDQSLQVLDNNLTAYIGSTDKALGITKAMSGGIVGLANNLDTLLPALIATAGALGTLYAGRRIQSVTGNAYSRAKDELKERRMYADATRENYAKDAAKTAEAQQRADATALKGQFGKNDFADKEAMKAYQRNVEALKKVNRDRQAELDAANAAKEASIAKADQREQAALEKANKNREAKLSKASLDTKGTEKALGALQKLDEKRLGLLGEQGDIRAQMAAIGQTTTPQMIDAGKRIKDAEDAITASLDKQKAARATLTEQSARLTSAIDAQSTRLNSLLGQQSTMTTTSPKLASLKTEIEQVQGVIKANQAEMARIQVDGQAEVEKHAREYTQQSARLATLRADSYASSSEKIVSLLRKQEANEASLAANDVQRQAAVARVREERASAVEKQAQREADVAKVFSAEQVAATKEAEKARTDAITSAAQKRSMIEAQSFKARKDTLKALNESGSALKASGDENFAAAVAKHTSEVVALTAAQQASGKAMEYAASKAGVLRFAMDGASKVWGSFVGFLGGPFGVALTAATAAMAFLGYEAQRSAVRGSELDEFFEQIGISAKKAEDRIKGVAKSLKDLRADQLRLMTKETQTQQDEMFGTSYSGMLGMGPSTIGDVQRQVKTGLIFGDSDNAALPENVRKAYQMISDLIDRMKSGTAPADDIAKTLDQIAKMNIGGNADELLKILRDMAPTVLRNQEGMKRMADEMERLDRATGASSGKMDRLPIPTAQNTLQEELSKRLAAGEKVGADELKFVKMDEYGQQIEEEAKKLAKAMSKATGTIISVDSQRAKAKEIVDAQMDQQAIGSGIAAFIRRVEGTSGPRSRGYNTTLDNGRWTGGDVNLTGMTLREVRALQDRMRTPENRAMYGNGQGSSALGAYQIVGSTLDGLIKKLGVDPDTTYFDQNFQDRAFRQLLRETGGDPNKIRQVWQGVDVAVKKGTIDNEGISRLVAGENLPAMDEEIMKRQQEATEGITEADIERKQAMESLAVEAKKQIENEAAANESIGATTQAQERARFAQELYNKALADGLPMNEQTIKTIEELADKYYGVADAREKANRANEDFIARADAFREGAGDALGTFISDLRDGKSATEALSNAIGRLGDRLLDLALNSIVDGLFGSAGTGEGIGGLFAKAIGGGVSGSVTAGVKHSGGRVSEHSGRRRQVSALAPFISPRFHSGLTTNEFMAVLDKSEQVLTGQQTGRVAGVMSGLANSAARGGGGTNIAIIDQRQAGSPPIEQERTTGPDGREQIRYVIRGEIQNEMGNRGSKTRRSLDNEVGLSPSLVRR